MPALDPLPKSFPDVETYQTSWRPFIIEEARAAVLAALQAGPPGETYSAALRASYWSVSDSHRAALSASSPSSSSTGASGT